ncbi:MAG: aminotransferase class III-fold pyridoxal phosphate-dependent enzyme [Bacteriovoracaceae bacterium]|nr:aminotransferase class III-fold pyridoxal phosphate-dependent enzyme [Bacteriovoracaceae bacterium]
MITKDVLNFMATLVSPIRFSTYGQYDAEGEVLPVNKTANELLKEIKTEFISGYGYQLLSPQNPVFEKFKIEQNGAFLPVGGSASTTSTGVYFTPLRNGFVRLLDEFSGLNLKFLNAFQAGSDANNYALELVSKMFLKEKSLLNGLKLKGKTLFFEGIFGGGRGEIKKYAFLDLIGSDRSLRPTPQYDPDTVGPNMLGSPLVTDPILINAKSESEIKALLYSDNHPYHSMTTPMKKEYLNFLVEQLKAVKITEEKVIEDLKNKIKVGDDENSISPKVAAIFIEPIQGINGVLFYRREFLLEIQKIAEQHEIVIIADEILTGGGRTGKFFAFQHYEGFTPDLISIGKGLQQPMLLGNIDSKISTFKDHFEPEFYLTVAYMEQLIKRGIAVMEAIKDQNLMERVKENGIKLNQVLLGIFRNSNNTYKGNFSNFPRGLGYLQWYPSKGNIDNTSARTAIGRVMPPLDATKEDIIFALTGDGKGSLSRDFIESKWNE